MKRIGVIAFGIMSLFTFAKSQDSKEAVFWKWFQANEVRLFDFEKDQNRIFRELKAELEKVQPELTFEFGPKKDGVREFVISADGLRAAFPAVVTLADKAPALRRWKFIKFRPRREPMIELERDGTRIKIEQIKFTIEPDGDKAGITLFMDGYEDSRHNTFAGIGFLYLDSCLGEYDVETKVGFIEFKSGTVPSKLAKHPLSELPVTFDRFVKSKLN